MTEQEKENSKKKSSAKGEAVFMLLTLMLIIVVVVAGFVVINLIKGENREFIIGAPLLGIVFALLLTTPLVPVFIAIRSKYMLEDNISWTQALSAGREYRKRLRHTKGGYKIVKELRDEVMFEILEEDKAK